MMNKVAGFDWDEGNIEKCQKHGVSIFMIEQLFTAEIHLLEDRVHSITEDRFLAVGRTSDERPLFVGFTYRKNKKGLMIRPFTARYMHKRELENYEKAFAKIQNR